MRLFRVILFTCYKVKFKTCIMDVHTTHTIEKERERREKKETDLSTPAKCVLSSNHLCTSLFSVALGIFQ